MLSRHLILFISLLSLTIFTLVAATACDPETPQPTPTPTPTIAPSATPSHTSTPTPSPTPSVTPTPTETPQPTFVSVPGPQPTRIVTPQEAAARQQYEENLAKWRAQHVLEYELVVRHESTAPFAGTWNLRVSADKIETLSYSAPSVITPTTPPAGMSGEVLRFMTVDELFKSVEFRLNEQFGSALEARADYLASFEPNLGYPVLVQIKPRRGTDLASSTTVERVTIIRRAILTPTPSPAPTDTPAPTPTNTPLPTLIPPTATLSAATATRIPAFQGTPSPSP